MRIRRYCAMNYIRDSIAEAIGISPNTVKEYMARLKKKQKIKRIGGDKGGYWEVLD